MNLINQLRKHSVQVDMAQHSSQSTGANQKPQLLAEVKLGTDVNYV